MFSHDAFSEHAISDAVRFLVPATVAPPARVDSLRESIPSSGGYLPFKWIDSPLYDVDAQTPAGLVVCGWKLFPGTAFGTHEVISDEELLILAEALS